jgi:beta-fructofuranosidase
MTFALPDHWVWDFWIADDGTRFHLYYLHAPRSLGDPELRHRNAAIGHAVSTDLVSWTDLGPVITAGRAGQADATASWTGSVVRDDAAGVWRMFYTGSRVLSATGRENIESIVCATSTDLHEWVTASGAAVEADGRWYELLGTGAWHEQAWRDPWVLPDPHGDGWHMLVTARAAEGAAEGTDERDRGVIGHAVSDDLIRWEVREPLSRPGAGFAHLEVVQWVLIEGRPVVLFSCDARHLAGRRAAAGAQGGVWAVPAGEVGTEIDVASATLLAEESLYAARVATARDGRQVLLGFENAGEHGEFVGRLSDPIPVRWTREGRLVAGVDEVTR